MITVTRITMATAATVALALSAAPAAAQQASATASATIKKPLALTNKQGLNFGDILVTGSGAFSSSVEIAANGTATCPSTYFTCSGTQQPAIFNASGNKQSQVKLTVDSTVVLQSATAPGDQLTMAVLLPSTGDTLTLTNSGQPGTDFNLGGRLTITDSTADGAYNGSISVTANYQ